MKKNPETLREFIVAKPAMFLAERWDNKALHRLVIEIITLAIKPEAMNNASKIDIILIQENVISIEDDGRGLPITPIRIGKSVERPALEHVLTWFLTTNPDNFYHMQFGFLNHLGGVLNALSARLIIETVFEGKTYFISGSRGEIIEPVHEINSNRERGTQITFDPDPDVFPDSKFYLEIFMENLRQIALLYPNIKFAFEDKKTHFKADFN